MTNHLPTWTRRDRVTGLLEQVSARLVTFRMNGRYRNLKAVMAYATIENPLTTGQADYWPTSTTPQTNDHSQDPGWWRA
jgi:hypothetical protein